MIESDENYYVPCTKSTDLLQYIKVTFHIFGTETRTNY